MTYYEHSLSALIAASILCGACSQGGFSLPAPSGVVPPPTQTAVSTSPQPMPSRPPASEAEVYAFLSASSSPVSGYTTTSRFLLWKDGTAQLQYEGAGYWATYTASQTELTFAWEGSNAANPWSATGTLVNDILTVRYNRVMQASDFEDAVYKRVSS